MSSLCRPTAAICLTALLASTARSTSDTPPGKKRAETWGVSSKVVDGASGRRLGEFDRIRPILHRGAIELTDGQVVKAHMQTFQGA